MKIHPKNVHENSPKKRSFHGQNVHEKTATQLNDIFNDYISHLNQTCGYNSEAQITDTQCNACLTQQNQLFWGQIGSWPQLKH